MDIAKGGRKFESREDEVLSTLAFYSGDAGAAYTSLLNELQSKLSGSAATHFPKSIEADGWFHVLGQMRVPSEVGPVGRRDQATLRCTVVEKTLIELPLRTRQCCEVLPASGLPGTRRSDLVLPGHQSHGASLRCLRT